MARRQPFELIFADDGEGIIISIKIDNVDHEMEIAPSTFKPFHRTITNLVSMSYKAGNTRQGRPWPIVIRDRDGSDFRFAVNETQLVNIGRVLDAFAKRNKRKLP